MWTGPAQPAEGVIAWPPTYPSSSRRLFSLSPAPRSVSPIGGNARPLFPVREPHASATLVQARSMEIAAEPVRLTEEQRRRIEASRLAALERLKRSAAAAGTTIDAASSRLAKCPRIAHPLPPRPCPPPTPSIGFRAVLEVCSPDEFQVTVGRAEGKAFPGEAECLRAVEDCVASVRSSHS